MSKPTRLSTIPGPKDPGTGRTIIPIKQSAPIPTKSKPVSRPTLRKKLGLGSVGK